MTSLIVAWGVLVGAAALWTGAPGGVFFTKMTGFFPPHYGYSTYAVSVLPLLAPRWLGAAAWATMLLSRNRAAQLGAVVGWAWAGGARQRAAAGFLGAALVLGGLALKPNGARNDSDRVMIWKIALRTAAEHPKGRPEGLYMGVNGYAVTKAHSDVLQLLVERGFRVTFAVLALLGWVLYLTPAGTPEKAALVCLLSQSVIDNRLHHPACAVLLAAVWVAAFLPRAQSRPLASERP